MPSGRSRGGPSGGALRPRRPSVGSARPRRRRPPVPTRRRRALAATPSSPPTTAVNTNRPSRFSNVPRSVTRWETRVPGEVTYGTASTVRRGVRVVTTTTSSATEATSFPPPDPTRNARPGISVESMLPAASMIAAPRQATEVVPGPGITMPRISDVGQHRRRRERPVVEHERVGRASARTPTARARRTARTPHPRRARRLHPEPRREVRDAGAGQRGVGAERDDAVGQHARPERGGASPTRSAARSRSGG